MRSRVLKDKIRIDGRALDTWLHAQSSDLVVAPVRETERRATARVGHEILSPRAAQCWRPYLPVSHRVVDGALRRWEIKMLPHETPENKSNLRRRALQFHYRSNATHVVPREEYQKKFVGVEGIFLGCDYSKIGKKE